MKYKEFVRMVRAEQQEGLTLVRAIFSVSDRLTAEEFANNGNPYVCKQGCNLCCHQVVCATRIEWREIHEFIRRLDQKTRYRLGRHLKPFQNIWTPWLQQHPSLIGVPAWEKYERGSALWDGKPCPFLGSEDGCKIYPVRPIDCRAFYSTQTCTAITGQQTVHYYKFEWQLHASTMLYEEQMKMTPKLGPGDFNLLLSLMESDPLIL